MLSYYGRSSPQSVPASATRQKSDGKEKRKKRVPTATFVLLSPKHLINALGGPLSKSVNCFRLCNTLSTYLKFERILGNRKSEIRGETRSHRPSKNSSAMTIPPTMRAVVVESTGGIDVLTYMSDHPTPARVPPGHALVRNEYAGLNFIDTYHRRGLYARECPFVIGQEGGGVVAGLHEDDTSVVVVKVGDRVAYCALVGSYAEYSLVPIDRLVRVPDSIDMSIAVACMTQGLTAHYLSSSVGAGIARPGDWVLVYGAGSGTGRWTARMCQIRGYRVIGITSRHKAGGYDNMAAAAAAFGCEELIVLENEPGRSYASYESVDVVGRVMDVTAGLGCKLVIDGVGLSTYEISIDCLSVRGLFVSYGNASGPVPAFPVLRLLSRSAYVTRPKLNDYVATRDELLTRADEVFEWVRTGKLDIVIDRVFALDEAAAGHEYLEDGRTRGKVLYKI
jgi:NADPH2:quinone reductase